MTVGIAKLETMVSIAAPIFRAVHEGKPRVPRTRSARVDSTGIIHPSSSVRTAPAPGRASYNLSQRAALALIAAAQQAIRIGLPLNLFVTVDLEAGGVGNCNAAITAFMRRARQWIRGAGFDTAHVWVQECGEVHGQHLHLLLHVPPLLLSAFTRRRNGWLTLAGIPLRRGHVRTNAVGPSAKAALGDQHSRAAYRSNLAAVVNYMLKETDTLAHAALEVTVPARGGIVYGKRSGTSQNIGGKARASQDREEAALTPWQLIQDPTPPASALLPSNFEF